MELDYECGPRLGKRWRHVTIGEMCMMAYGFAVQHMDAKARKQFDHDLAPDELVAIFDDSVPVELRGVRPPSWWVG